jgi:hypothetical protein
LLKNQVSTHEKKSILFFFLLISIAFDGQEKSTLQKISKNYLRQKTQYITAHEKLKREHKEQPTSLMVPNETVIRFEFTENERRYINRMA